MLTYPTLVDVEALVVAYLLQDADIEALVADRIAGDIPQDPTYPLLRVQRIGGAPAIEQWLDAAMIQVDAYADARDEAWAIIAASQRTLHQMRLATHDLGVVSAVETVSGPVPVDDPETERPRFVLTVLVHVHPHAQSGS